MDITDTLLGALDVSVDPFAVCDVRDGRYLDLPGDSSVSIHYVLSGTGILSTRGHEPIVLQPDQVILIPKGMAQRIKSSKGDNVAHANDSICLQPADSLAWLDSGEGGTDIVLACGRIRATYGQEVDIFSMLDRPLVETFHDSAYIRGAFNAILQEFCQPQLGTLALTSSLMKQCLILLLRRLHSQQDWRIPWLAMLDNRGLQNALRAILDAPEKPYRVEDLAELASMSRSAFSDQFVKALGQPPGEFLSSYRLRRAAELLVTTEKPIESIANQVGFQSRSSFSRAFRRQYDLDPAAYRQCQGRGDNAVMSKDC